MYLEFYGLKEKPFALSPDPRFLYPTPGHREALAQLLYGVREGVGFLLLTAEVGTGKTTLIHALARQLGAGVAVAFVVHSRLPFDGLLEHILRGFGIAPLPESRAQRLMTLHGFLIERRAAGETVLLVLDEAQHLDVETLEDIRLLSNFETPNGKLLQTLLAGQPELSAKLNLPALRQLKQRIAIRATIRPLTVAETRRYILARLRVAGAPDLGLFGDDAVRRIAQYTRGVPRLVNIVCDHCLLHGYADQRRRIDRKIVKEVIRYFEDPEARRAGGELGRRRPLGWAVGAVAAALVGWVALLSIGSEGSTQVAGVAATRLLDWARTVGELLGR